MKPQKEQSIVKQAYNIMSLYPDVDWNELYIALFKRSYEEGNKDFAVQVFYRNITEAIRTKDNWELDGLVKDEKYNPILSELKLLDFSKDVIKVTPKKSHSKIYQKEADNTINFQRNFMFQFRVGSEHHLCSCCHNYVLTCDEIQQFPLIDEEKYIREKFHLALSQDLAHKRKFMIESLLSSYAGNLIKNGATDYSLFFELWIIAEKSGIHASPFHIIDNLPETFFIDNNFQSFLQIIRFRNYRHNDFIDELIEYYLKRENLSMAIYLNAKLSTPFCRLFYTLQVVLNSEGQEQLMCEYLQRVVASVKHEKVINDED
jgi:hypothetical protein